MTLPGETVGYHADGIECEDCRQIMEYGVQRSAAGYYLGYFCGNCGPYSRETGYYYNGADAQDGLDKIRRGERPVNPRPGNM